MSRLTAKVYNFLMFSMLLPFVYGCNGGGGGGGTSLGALFQSDPNSGSTTETLLVAPGDLGGEVLTQVHNPEPATLLLLGGGMMAMGYFKNRAQKNIR